MTKTLKKFAAYQILQGRTLKPTKSLVLIEITDFSGTRRPLARNLQGIDRFPGQSAEYHAKTLQAARQQAAIDFPRWTIK